MNTTCLPYWVHVIQAVGPSFVAVIAAVIAGLIAFRQWQTARTRIKLDLFNERFELDFGQNLNGLAIDQGAKHGVHQFLYGHGQAETARKIAVVSTYPANALSPALSKLAKVELTRKTADDLKWRLSGIESDLFCLRNTNDDLML